MAVGGEPQSFLFLSAILGSKIVDSEGHAVGRVLDLVGNIQESYPPVTHVLLRLEKAKRVVQLSWRKVELSNGTLIAHALQQEDFREPALTAGELFLKDALLDKQVVDTDGAKIRRVNDLQFLKAHKALYLVHVDVGFHGLLRRVGLQRPAGFLFRKLFDYNMTDQLISWKFVQPLSSPDLLRLTIAHKRLAHLHPADLADIIEELDIHQRSAVFRSLDVEMAAETLEETDPKIQVSLIQDLDMANASDIIEEMSLSEAADLLGDLPRDKAEGILREMEQAIADDMKELLSHPEEKAGGLMTTSFLRFAPAVRVGEALETIRSEAEDMDLIYYLYVVDSEEHILGVLSLRDLLIAKPETSLSDIMDTRVISVGIEEKKDQIADDFAKYGIMAIPVVDGDERLKGVILFKNLLEVVAPKLGR
ncbi:MAG: CBS domain-containing protein [Proteobacteria bacterium]|nr:CBS domain-containing protein [Pseudomonadota bacterium]MBU2261427.1 CBS domain-containing protein [Pseudomonadota bacterium]